MFFNMFTDFKWMNDALEYYTDAWQRSILFTDILRKRGNNYIEHIKEGQPPVLVFDYKVIMDARAFEKPVNYALVQIIDRRTDEEKAAAMHPEKNRRRLPVPQEEMPDKPKHHSRRPIVVIDPRAGHGPGIGGSKLNSQIGVALDKGHPVYFVTFFTEPEPGQTLSRVQEAEILFLEEVVRRHPDTDKPAVIGNCQAGWAAALIGADRPDVTGPLVFNGSPLSYWGGVEGANPMRYKGGLCGGVWLTSLWCDLGNGKFDGASLVSGFEDLNPANTLWTKQYNVYSKVDTEEKRFLDFEKWWGGFFKMNSEEIHFIVDGLFVGNELEQGHLELKHGKVINLKNFKDPIVVFASSGDNITPPQQALNWIYKVYGTADEIKRCGQVIIYMVHEKVGHLGIFVSGSVAQKEHKEIIGSVEMMEYLKPGLYEMVISGDPSHPELDDYKVEFYEREMEDILKLDDGLEEEEAFRPVAAISRFNDKIYNAFFSPWVRLMTNELTAEWTRQLHPMRMQRYILSDMNPFILPVGKTAEMVRKRRQPVRADNLFLKWEKVMSESIQTSLNVYRDIRDSAQENLFMEIYNNSWMKILFPEPQKTGKVEKDPETLKEREKIEHEMWLRLMERGGFPEAVFRIILAVAGTNHAIDRRQYRVAGKIIQVNERLKSISPKDMKWMVKTQSAVLEKDQDAALESLTVLLPEKDDREEAFEIANSVATADLELDDGEIKLLERIKGILELESGQEGQAA